ncbi:MAG: hypothetical protein ACTS5I_13745 [Rhodanobacter sp.]
MKMEAGDCQSRPSDLVYFNLAGKVYGTRLLDHEGGDYVVVEQGTHGGMIVPTMPVVLDFFADIAAGPI